MKNLTPHPITLNCPDGSSITFQPSGVVARVTTKEEVCGELHGLPVVCRQFGAVTGLPENGEPCLVSALVLGACHGAPDVYAPDTGPTAIRNEQGQVVAVTRLVAA